MISEIGKAVSFRSTLKHTVERRDTLMVYMFENTSMSSLMHVHSDERSVFMVADAHGAGPYRSFLKRVKDGKVYYYPVPIIQFCPSSSELTVNSKIKGTTYTLPDQGNKKLYNFQVGSYPNELFDALFIDYWSNGLTQRWRDDNHQNDWMRNNPTFPWRKGEQHHQTGWAYSDRDGLKRYRVYTTPSRLSYIGWAGTEPEGSSVAALAGGSVRTKQSRYTRGLFNSHLPMKIMDGTSLHV